MTQLALFALLIAYLPGALVFRLPVGGRERRASLDAAERLFWHVILSVAWSLIVVLVLAALEAYRFERLLWINGAVSGLVLLAGRGGLRYRGSARRPSWTLVLPVALLAIGLLRFFPASEYIIGGRDPGTYINEGIQIAQRGTLAIHDALVPSVSVQMRDLFFPTHYDAEEFSSRFMGFYLLDPRTGEVMGQFPHLFPASIAIGYGLHGLTGARLATGVWGLLGVLAVYFAGARLIGHVAAFAAAALLSLNVVTVWFARYPNAELAMQALLFAALLAFARAHQDDDGFFAPVAGALAALLLFLRIDSLVALTWLIAAAMLVFVATGRRPRAGFVLPLAIGGIVGWFYLTGPLRAYVSLPLIYLRNLPAMAVWAAVFGSIGAWIAMAWLRRRHSEGVRKVVPIVIAAVVVTLAVYAWFFRHPGGRLTEWDAYALRTFAAFYLHPVVLLTALVGLVLIARHSFWRDPALVVTVIGFSLIFFYKIKIVPEHFWAARRFLPVILPGALLFAAAAGLASFGRPWRGWHVIRAVVGVAVLGFAAERYLVAASPVMPHVEYAGIIPYLERIATTFGDRDLVIVESRNTGSDVHTLALPLAYIYAKNVLVLSSPRPDKLLLRGYLEEALQRYQRIFFLGGGGTDLLSRRIMATQAGSEKARFPEYESRCPVSAHPRCSAPSVWDTYPRGVRQKDFDYGIFQLELGTPTGPFLLDVGGQDDLNVVRFYAKETTEGRTIRWTGRNSQIAIPGMTGSEREAVFVMHDGGRPKGMPPARVEVFFDDVPIGTIDVGSGFQTYEIKLPPELVARAAARDDPAQLRLASTVWRPRDALGGSDDRELGVMVDRVEVR